MEDIRFTQHLLSLPRWLNTFHPLPLDNPQTLNAIEAVQDGLVNALYH